MTEIRPFCNADLPGLLSVWIDHWSAVGQPPAVSAATIEQSILARTFFDADHLLVAHEDGVLQAWAHMLPESSGLSLETTEKTDGSETTHANSLYGSAADSPQEGETAILAAICFDAMGGLAICDRLLDELERQAQSLGFGKLLTGPVRDDHCGYAGLSPIGHGIGIPNHDARTASLLSRHGYVPESTLTAYSVVTNTYRPPVSREAMNLRRSTRTDVAEVYPETPRRAAAMAHLDIERHQLIEHRTGTVLAEVGLWISDPEAQVMDCSRCILDLSTGVNPTEANPSPETLAAEAYLIGTVVQSLPNRRIFELETVVDDSDSARIGQLESLRFTSDRRGQRWKKDLPRS